MPTPKGMRFVQVAVGNTDAVHIYSDAHRIWIQLRRDVPTVQDIGKPSFKVALGLTPEQAIDIARELFTAATRKGPAKAGVGSKQPQKTKHAQQASK